MSETTLRELAGARGVSIGAALAVEPLAREPAYARTAAREFNQATPENAMKWAVVEATRGQRRYGPADVVVAFAAAHGMRVKGHTLVWHGQLPPWVRRGIGAAALDTALANHIGSLVGRYRGRVAAWDVVNEAAAPDGSGFRRSVFLDRLGDGYVGRAFHLAHLADPDAQLFYNDYGIETATPKADFVYRLLGRLRAAGVPVHGVGFQMHVDAARPPDAGAVRRSVARFATLGLVVAVSEMDVRVRRLPAGRAGRLARQSALYRDLVAACLSVPECRTVTVWGFSDRHSWIDARWGADDPLLFDEAYERKPAYFGVRDALRGMSRAPPVAV